MKFDLPKHRLIVINGALLFILLGSYWGQRTEGATVQQADYLHGLSLPFRGWKTADTNLTEHERELLRPDAVLLRSYTSSAGEYANLAVIAGHRKQTVHTPAFCMAGGGWNTTASNDFTMVLGQVKISATRAVMQSDQHELLVTYFFTDGQFCTQSLPVFQGKQMIERFQGTVPLGALVRIVIPIQSDRSSAERLSDDFAQAVLPEVLRGLRTAHR